MIFKPYSYRLLAKTREDFVDALCDAPPNPVEMARILRANQGWPEPQS